VTLVSRRQNHNEWSKKFFDERPHRMQCRYWGLNDPFCCVQPSREQRFPLLFSWPDNPQKMPLPLGHFNPHLIHVFPGPRQWRLSIVCLGWGRTWRWTYYNKYNKQLSPRWRQWYVPALNDYDTKALKCWGLYWVQCIKTDYWIRIILLLKKRNSLFVFVSYRWRLTTSTLILVQMIQAA